MKFIIRLILLLLLPMSLFGTPQLPDYIICDNDTLAVFSNPIGEITEKLKLDENFEINPCKYTACWRGYIAFYKVIDSKLYLIELASSCDYKIKADLSKVFKDEYKNGKVFIKSITGKIYASYGKIIYYNDLKPEWIFSNEIIMKFKNGLMIEKENVDNTKTRLTYYNTPDKLTAYIIKNSPVKLVNNLINKGAISVDIKCDDNGQVTDVKINSISLKNYTDEIIKVIMTIDDWDVLYQHGERVNLQCIYVFELNQKVLENYYICDISKVATLNIQEILDTCFNSKEFDNYFSKPDSTVSLYIPQSSNTHLHTDSTYLIRNTQVEYLSKQDAKIIFYDILFTDKIAIFDFKINNDNYSVNINLNWRNGIKIETIKKN